jgi:hypothetical protein
VAARSSAPVLGALCSTSESKAPDGLDDDLTGSGPFSLHHWSISTGYRHQYSHRHFVGTKEQTQREALGTEVVNSINLFDVGLTYKFNPRWSMTLSVPILNATRIYDHQLFQTLLHIPNAPDQVSNSNGIGDVGLSAQFWLIRPPAENGHNVAFSFGATFPTGNSAAKDTVETVNGRQTVFVDQSIQPGSGGYGISLGTQAYQQVKRAVLYVSGNYLLTPQESNGTPNASLAGVKFPPNPLTSTMSIPDQYLVDGGVAYPFPKIKGLAFKTGLRYEGVKVRDLIGGSLGFRRPGYALSVEPGFQYERGKDTWSFNLPVAVQRNRKRSVPDQIQGGAGDAAFADYMILVGYSRRF